MKEKTTTSSTTISLNLLTPQVINNVDVNINNCSKSNDTLVPISNQCNSQNCTLIPSTYVNHSVDFIEDQSNNDTLKHIINTNVSDDTINICDKLRSWVVAHNVTRRCVNSILCIMKDEGLNVPLDVRCLMKTPKLHEIKNISDGSYVHLGISKMLIPLLTKYNINLQSNVLEIGLNIDGLPLSKSSKSQCWPILISILNVKELYNIVIPIGVFHGLKKPKCIQEFLNPFISDILGVMSSGLLVNGKNFKLEIKNIVCDAPAKSFILNVKSHNAYFGCNSCIIEGTFIENRVAFLGVDVSLRTDYSFRKRLDEDYHKGNSPLTLLPINITEVVCLDYMHNLCLGITKRLLEFWVRGKKDVRLTDMNKEKINNELMILRSYVPIEFSRLPRSLDDYHFWKATELRNFLVYFGCIVLKGKLNRSLYSHFLLLVNATRILLCSETCQVHNDTAFKLLKEFVINYGALYGQHFVTYNVHSVIHMPMFVKIHGPLDNFSCFRYENFLQELKKSVKCARFPLQEIFNRIIEKQQLLISSQYQPPDPYICYNEDLNNISSTFIQLSDRVYKKIVLNNFKITLDISKLKDKCLMLTNKDLVVVEHIVKPLTKNPFLIVKKLLNCVELTSEPILSTVIGLYMVDTEKKSDTYCVQISVIKYKCVFVPISNISAVLLTLCHKE